MRRSRLIPLALLGLLLLLAAGLWLFRLAAAEQALASWLELKGLEGSAEVVRLGPRNAELRDLTLEGQQVRRLELHYDLPALIRSGRIERVEAEGLRLAADLTSERPLGRLGEAFAGTPDGEAAPFSLPVLPVIELRDAELALATARGPLRLALDGSLLADEEAPEPARRLNLKLHSLEGPLPLSGTASGRYRPLEQSGSRLALALASDQGPPLSLAAEAEIEGAAGSRDLRFSLDLAGDLPLLGTLAALPEAERPIAGAVSLQAQGVAALQPLLDGEPARLLTEPGALPDLAASLQVEDLALPGRGSGIALASAAELVEEAGEKRLRLRPSEASAAGLDATWLQALGLPPSLAGLLAPGAALSVTSDAAAPLELALPDAGAGSTPQALLDLTLVLEPADGGRLEADLAGALALATPAALPRGEVAGALRAQALVVPEAGGLAAGSAGFALELAPERSRLLLQGPVQLEALALAPATLEPLPEAWRPLLAGPLDLTLESPAGSATLAEGALSVVLPQRLVVASGEAGLEATLEGSLALADGALQNVVLNRLDASAHALPTPYGLLRSLSLAGRFEGLPGAAAGEATLALEIEELAVADAGAASLSARLPLELAWDEAALDLALSAPGALDLQDPTAPLAAAGRLSLDVQAAELSLGAAATRLTLEAALPTSALDLDRRGRKDDLGLSAGRIALDLTLPDSGPPQGSAELAGLEVRHGEAGLALRDGTLGATFGAEPARLQLTGASVSSTAEPPLFPPLRITGNGEQSGTEARFRLQGRGLEGALVANLQGRYDLERGRGTAELIAEPLTFAPGGPQPADLNAGLAMLEQASGSLSARADLRFGAGFSGSGRLALEALGFTVAGASVRGLDLALALDSLSPLTSPPDQPFSIAGIDFGVPLADVTGTLQLIDSGGTTAVRLGRTQGAFLDGRLAFDGTVIDPASPRQDVTLLIENVDLERLLALAGLEEVSGQGRLSGSLPLSIVDGEVVVRDGRLAAESPGVIAFKSEEARQALASGGESVELLLQALEDFHYQVLALTLDKPAAGDSRVLLRLEGSNPTVLEGQPFVLNINLTSNAAPLLAALARGTEISNRLVEELMNQRSR